MIFQESGWQFEFDDDWQVKKFDSHRYYLSLSGSGFKGLDFIAIKPNQQLLLIEVKNYRDQEPPRSQDLAEIFNQKLMDSLEVMNIVQKYYERNWSYRVSKPIIKKYPTYFGEKGFWTEALDLVEQHKSHAILWLDAPLAIPNYMEQTTRHIIDALPSSFTFSLEPFAAQAKKMGVQIQCC